MRELIGRFKCWVGWHDDEVIRFTNYWENDLGMDLKCKRCGYESWDGGYPMG